MLGRNKKKRLSLLMAMTMLLTLVIGQFNILKVNAVEGKKVEMTINKDRIAVGESAYIKAKLPASDEEIYKAELTLSREYMYGNEESVNSIININKFTYDKGSSTLTFIFTMADNIASCNWKAQSLRVIYEDGSEYNYNDYDINGFGTLTTSGTEGKVDYKAPTVSGISINKQRVTIGDKVELLFDIKDDISGVKGGYVELGYGMDGYNSFESTEIYYLNKVSDTKWKVEIEIDNQTLNGMYSVGSVYVEDNKGNGARVYSDDKLKGGYTVYGAYQGTDIYPPIVTKVTNSINNIGADLGEKFTINVDAKDNSSGVKNIKVTYFNDFGKTLEYSGFTYSSTTNSYIKDVTVSDKNYLGYWRFKSVEVEDNKGNSKIYGNTGDNYVNGASFTIKNINNAPKITRAYFDKSVVLPGETTTVYAYIKDTLGVVESIDASFYIEDENAVSINGPTEYVYDYESVKLTYDSGLKAYKGTFTANNKTPKGELGAYFDLNSKEGIKRMRFSRQVKIKETDCTVMDYIERLNSLTLSKTAAKVSETISFNAKLNIDGRDEDLNRNINLEYELPNNNSRNFTVSLSYNSAKDEFTTNYKIPNDMPSGKYTLQSATINDEYGDYVRYLDISNISNKTLQITGTENKYDYAPPELKSISILNKNLKPGDKLEIEVAALDNRDKNLEIYAVVVPNVGENSNANGINSTLSFNEVTGIYEGSIYIDRNMPSGSWKISEVILSDSSNNRQSYDEQYLLNKGATFNITGGSSPDFTRPIFNGITISNNEPKIGETVKLSIDAEDRESGIDYVRATYSTPQGYKDFHFIYNNTTEKYEASFTVNNYYINGEWRLEGIYISNKENSGWSHGFLAIYGFEIDLSPYKILISGSNNLFDITPPMYKNFTIDKTKARIGEKVRVSVEATDDITYDLAVNIYYTVDGETYSSSTGLNKNEGSNIYSGTIYVPRNIYGPDVNNLVIDGISLSDMYGNETLVKNLNNNKIQLFDEYDLNMNGENDITDLAIIASKYNSKRPNDYYGDWENESYDFNLDGRIDIYDIVKVASSIE